ncbi:MAG: BofC C-terminal domain-containing protein [Bacillota bacterium]
MRRNDLSRKLIFWKLLAFDGGKVIVRREYHDLCQACKEKRYLGLQNHQVALYRGIPGLGRLEKVLPDIQISALPMEEVDDLSKGIPVTSEREMLQIIEGWSEKPD